MAFKSRAAVTRARSSLYPGLRTNFLGCANVSIQKHFSFPNLYKKTEMQISIEVGSAWAGVEWLSKTTRPVQIYPLPEIA
jgi:hypothetical protein